MANDKVSLPSGTGGLVRYFDEYKSPFQIEPETVVIICAAVIVLAILLKYSFSGFL